MYALFVTSTRRQSLSVSRNLIKPINTTRFIKTFAKVRMRLKPHWSATDVFPYFNNHFENIFIYLVTITCRLDPEKLLLVNEQKFHSKTWQPPKNAKKVIRFRKTPFFFSRLAETTENCVKNGDNKDKGL